MWNSEQRNMIWSYANGEVQDDRLKAALGIDEDNAAAEVRRELIEASSTRSAENVEAALYIAFKFNVPTRAILELICMLLREDWHVKHEDMIGMLQDLAHPSTVAVLEAAIELKPKLEYLSYDDYGSYYKKCIWALYDVGTAEAVAAIERCANSNDQVLRDQAIYRLSKMR